MFISGVRLKNFEIRVGLYNGDLGNNELCYKQFNSVAAGATIMFKCDHTLYGDWVSVNKSDDIYSLVHLQLCELRVFGSNMSEYIHRTAQRCV